MRLQLRVEIGTAEEIAVRAFESVLDQALRSLGVRDSSVEFGDLALGEAIPGRTSCRLAASSWRISASVKPGVLVEADKRDALSARRRVVPSLADALGADSRPSRS